MRKVLTASITFVLLGVAVVSAQMNVAEIGGLVTDPAGASIPGSAISATNLATGATAHAEASAQGSYRFAQLAPGTYTLSANGSRFRKAIQENVTLHAGEKLELNFSMVLGERTETLLVEEFPGMLQTESAQVRDVVENQQVLDLPVKDREFLELALLGSRSEERRSGR